MKGVVKPLLAPQCPSAKDIGLIPIAQHQAEGPIQASLHPNQKGGLSNCKARRVEEIMKTYSMREVLEGLDRVPDAWFYLPNTSWTLDTKGAFSLDSRDFAPDSTDFLPPQVASEGWIETLDTTMIQDVIDYTDQQLPSATVQDYFEAFKCYSENDAFLEF